MEAEFTEAKSKDSEENPKASQTETTPIEKDSIAKFIIRFLKGLAIGIGGIIPGISGGVLAVIMGVYERFAQAVAHPFKRWRQDLPFFLPIIAGGAAGILIFSWAVKYFYVNYAMQVIYLFIGCIVGTLPSLYKKANSREKKKTHWITFFIALAAMVAISFIRGHSVPVNVNPGYLVLFAGGLILGFGTIIPGICSSFILIYLGIFHSMLDAVVSLRILDILAIGAGCVLVIILFAKLMDYLFRKYHGYVYFAILGVVLASIYAIFPGFDWGVTGLINFGLFFFGLIASFLLSRLEKE